MLRLPILSQIAPPGILNGCHRIPGSSSRPAETDNAVALLPAHLTLPVSPTPWALQLEGNQLGELGRNIFHGIFCRAQAASRAEQRADFAKSLIRRAVHYGNEQVTR